MEFFDASVQQFLMNVVQIIKYSSSAQVEGIVNYLKKNPVFQRLKKFGYAFRISMNLDGVDVVVEDCRNDDRLEGCGEKMLHLLQKFNVENVLLIMGIDRNDNYSILNPEYYHIIIERAKDLLSTLYEKVIENEVSKKIGQEQEQEFLQTRIDSRQRQYIAPKTKVLDFSNIPVHQESKKKSNERPNYYLNPNQREQIKQKMQITVPVEEEREKINEKFIKRNMERNSSKIQNILDNWGDNDFQYLKFMSLYDRNTKVEKVFKMLMVLEDVKSIQDLSQNYDFRTRLPALANSFVGKEKAKKITEMLRVDKYLNSKILMVENHVIAALLDFLTLVVKNYELTQKMLDDNYKKMAEKSQSPERTDNGFEGNFPGANQIRGVMTKEFDRILDDKIKIRVENNEIDREISKLQDKIKTTQKSREPKEDASTHVKEFKTNSSTDKMEASKKNTNQSQSLDPSKSSKRLVEPSIRSSNKSLIPEQEYEASVSNRDFGSFKIDDIPTDPEGIKRFVDENPVDQLSPEILEVIAERLQNYRSKNP